MTANSFAHIETDKEAKVEVTNLMVEYKQVLYETLSSSSLRGGRSCSVWLRRTSLLVLSLPALYKPCPNHHVVSS